MKKGRIADVGKMVADFIFPSNIYCICCDNLIDKSRRYALCDRCMESLHWANENTCQKCGKVLADTEKRQILKEVYRACEGPEHGQHDGESPHAFELCGDCRQNSHYFEKGFTCMIYGSKEKEMMHKYKFNGKAYMGEKLGEIMLDRILLEHLEVDLVTAVPSHPKNMAKRGYNQAELMAKTVAKGLDLVYNNQVLIRKNYKKPMNKLDANERHLNVKSAYDAGSQASEIQNKRILLIDDIYTTGSTVDECSRLLLENGADKVYVLTLAAGAD